MSNSIFWKKYLFIISYIIIGIGVYVTFFKTTILYKPFNVLVNPVFWPNGLHNEGTLQFSYFVYSLMGACMIVWGIFFFQLIKYAFNTYKIWVWQTLLITTTVWFLIDESYSLLYKVYNNALLNIVLLVMIFIPIITTKKYFIEN